MTSLRVHELVRRGRRGHLIGPQRETEWGQHRKVRCYATLLTGYGPGMLWSWRTSVGSAELILDGVQRLRAIMHLHGLSAPTPTGLSDVPPTTKVQFNPSSRTFRFTDPDEPSVPAIQTDSRPKTGWVDTAPLLMASDSEAREMIRRVVLNLPASGEDGRELHRDALCDLRDICKVEIAIATFTGGHADALELVRDINHDAPIRDSVGRLGGNA